jgi:hypothetical protein
MKPSKYHTVYSGEDVVEQRELTYEWHELRILRDEILDQSDWRAMKDRTLSTVWKDYRQALRDLPQDFDSANDAVDNWPDPPE